MCIHCENQSFKAGEEINGYIDGDIYYTKKVGFIRDNTLNVYSANYMGEAETVSIPSNYCLICGRKLRDNSTDL